LSATHSQTFDSMFAHIPGLKVVAPATPADMKGMFRAAMADPDPVIFIEHTLMYGIKGEVPEGDYIVPIGKSVLAREGRHITVVTYSRMVHLSLQAADILAKEGIEVEIVDLRTIRQLDIDTVLASVAKTHRVLIVEEQKPFASVGSQLAYMIQREAFDELDGPIHRLATVDAPAIYSPPVEIEQLPNPQRVLKAALEAVG